MWFSSFWFLQQQWIGLESKLHAQGQFWPISCDWSLYIPWKHQKTIGSQMFLGAMERGYWYKWSYVLFRFLTFSFSVTLTLDITAVNWYFTVTLWHTNILSNCFTTYKKYDEGLLRSVKSGFAKRQYKFVWKMFTFRLRFSSGWNIV